MTWMQDRPKARARRKRRGLPIRAYVGPNSSGKSWTMVYDALLGLERGRPALSTVRLLDYKNPRPCPGGLACDDPDGHDRPVTKWELKLVNALDPDDLDPDPADPNSFYKRVEHDTGETVVHACAHPLYTRFTSFAQLIEWRNGSVLMDEVNGVASSRQSMAGMPFQVEGLLVQLRRRNVDLAWSTPNWARADKIIREVTQGVSVAWGMAPKPAPPDETGMPREWMQNRIFEVRTYNTMLMEEFSAARADDIPHITRAYYLGSGSTTFQAYDTYDAVTSLGWANEAGICLNCGGKRSIPKCGCEDHKSLGEELCEVLEVPLKPVSAQPAVPRQRKPRQTRPRVKVG